MAAAIAFWTASDARTAFCPLLDIVRNQLGCRQRDAYGTAM